MARKPLSRLQRGFGRSDFDPLGTYATGQHITQEIADSGQSRLNASFLIQGQSPRDPASLIARLLEQFIRHNRHRLLALDLEVEPQFDGKDIYIKIRTGAKIGAISLISPTSGKSDYGLVVKPRYGWSGIGAILAATGWRTLPSILAQPMLPRSDRKISSLGDCNSCPVPTKGTTCFTTTEVRTDSHRIFRAPRLRQLEPLCDSSDKSR